MAKIDLNPFDNIGASAAKGAIEALEQFLAKYPKLQDGLKGELVTLELSAEVSFRLKSGGPQ